MANGVNTLLPALEMLNTFLDKKARTRVYGDYTSKLTDSISKATDLSTLNSALQTGLNEIYQDEYLSPEEKSQLVQIANEQARYQGGIIGENLERQRATETVKGLDVLLGNSKFELNGNVADADALKARIRQITDDPVMQAQLYAKLGEGLQLAPTESVSYDPLRGQGIYERTLSNRQGMVLQRAGGILTETSARQLYADTNANRQLDPGEEVSANVAEKYREQKARADYRNQQLTRTNDKIVAVTLDDGTTAVAVQSYNPSTRKITFTDSKTGNDITGKVNLNKVYKESDSSDPIAEQNRIEILTKKLQGQQFRTFQDIFRKMATDPDVELDLIDEGLMDKGFPSAVWRRDVDYYTKLQKLIEDNPEFFEKEENKKLLEKLTMYQNEIEQLNNLSLGIELDAPKPGDALQNNPAQVDSFSPTLKVRDKWKEKIMNKGN
jgi:hypothetical protein